MSNPRVELRHARPLDPSVLRGKRLGQILVSQGLLSLAQLSNALIAQRSQRCHLGKMLVAEGILEEHSVYRALAYQHAAPLVRYNPQKSYPETVLSLLAPEYCVTHNLIPWQKVGTRTMIATSDPEHFEKIQTSLASQIGPVVMMLIPQTDLDQLFQKRFARYFAARSVNQLPSHLTCRDLPKLSFFRAVALALACVVLGSLFAHFPTLSIQGLVFALGASLMGTSCLRLLAIWQNMIAAPAPASAPMPLPMPRISIMVPLYKEARLIPDLVARFSTTNYPKALLDFILVLEEDDKDTQAAVAACDLPDWMRSIVVPSGTPQTKPRALNSVLPFCRGEIIGIYDAEDIPDPDQLFEVAQKFAKGDEKLGCIQGVLDYYNVNRNWIARCFTIEYAAWFRVLLPGLSRAGFVVPLGGTTLFLRRKVFDVIGVWDPYNVTEDADLGIRLARFGYRTELISSVTKEEANFRAWPWVRQRGRWLKGYILTYWRHGVTGGSLRKDVGLKAALGIHIMFGGALLQIFGAPVLWTLWLAMVGADNPMRGLPDWTIILMGTICVLSWVINAGVLILGSLRSGHEKLWPWCFTTPLYFPLAVLAAYRVFIETLWQPYFWDKTEHGIDRSPLPKTASPSKNSAQKKATHPSLASKASPAKRKRVTNASEICAQSAS